MRSLFAPPLTPPLGSGEEEEEEEDDDDDSEREEAEGGGGGADIMSELWGLIVSLIRLIIVRFYTD